VRIRYITGRGGELDKGLSLHLSQQTVDYQGLAINSSFLTHSLAHQIDLVRQHALSAGEGHLIATSYGAYLLMLSLIDVPSAPDRVLLISPVLGTAIVPTQMSSFRPPQANRLKLAIAGGRVVKPSYLRIITGEDDPICCPNLARFVAKQMNVDQLDIISEAGHNLPKDTLDDMLQEFLTRP
jgi:hypothetical protein